MLRGLFKKGSDEFDRREIARLQKVVERVNALEPAFEALDDAHLRAKTDEFRRRLAEGETLDDLLVEVFAAVREASKRTVGMRHYDVQLIGGVLLYRGKIVEMKTGEGKTLVATLPLYLSALEGRGVHLVTVNDYLAQRDGGWMGPIFDKLGMSVGLVIPHASAMYDPLYVDPGGVLEDERLVHWRPVARKEAYRADVTYGTNNEFGFDYLRDNMAHELDDCVQRELQYAVIDEVDNVLIDEARTPLIISGPAEESSDLYRRFAEIVPRLRVSSPESVEQEEPDGDYVLEEKTQIVTLTERGADRVEKMLPELAPGESLYDPKHAHMLAYFDNALRAHVVYKRDKDYIVKDGEVIIVDEFTGRLMYGRRFSEGLHQAIEAKERVAVRRESMTYATITFQNYFRMYARLAGMTGTAKTEEEEFRRIYNREVAVLPTNVEYGALYGDLIARERTTEEIEEVTFAGALDGQHGVPVTVYESPSGNGRRYFRRLDLTDVIYAAEDLKFQAVADEIEALHKAGRPVLVGTIAIETSERLASVLQRRGVAHQVLNGKMHEKEAAVIAQAGRPGAVTIATNMAGRGVDILLGGNPDGLAAKLLEQRFRQAAEGFARGVIDGQEAQALQIVQGVAGFSGGSLDMARALKAEYELYEEALSQGRLPRFIADQLVKEGTIDGRLHGPVVGVAGDVLLENWEAALGKSRLPEELSQRIVGEIQRVRAHYGDPGSKVAYIANGLFSHYYMAMSALIRAVLQNDHAKVQALVAEYPELNQELAEEVMRIREQCRQDGQAVRARGGLHVVGTERHEARRIDNQLRGRAGRQGDPGSSRFFISLEDELMRRFGGERVKELMSRFGVEENVPLQHSWLDKSIESAQTRVEGYNFDIRKHVLEYDDVVNKQREFFYAQRRQVLEASDLRDQVLRMVREEISGLVAALMPGPAPEDWDLAALHQELRSFLPLSPTTGPAQWARMTPAAVEEELSRLAELRYDDLNRDLAGALLEAARQENLTLANLSGSPDPLRRLIYRQVLDRLGSIPEEDLLNSSIRKLPAQIGSEVEAAFVDGLRLQRDRRLILGAVDRLWVRHLTTLEALREGIGLRAYGQQNPLVAYRKEAHEMYEALLDGIQRMVARSVYLVAQPSRAQRPQRRRQQQGRPVPQAADASKKTPGRNDPCWCGSGIKYKNCHMRLDQDQGRGSTAGRSPSQPSASRRGKRRSGRRG